MTSPAAQVILSVIPIVGIVFAATLVFFALLWKHSENKLRIKNGTYQNRDFNLRVFSLLAGLVLIGVGLVLTVMFYILGEGITWGLLSGLLTLVIGIMLLIFYKVNPDYHNNGKE